MAKSVMNMKGFCHQHISTIDHHDTDDGDDDDNDHGDDDDDDDDSDDDDGDDDDCDDPPRFPRGSEEAACSFNSIVAAAVTC